MSIPRQTLRSIQVAATGLAYQGPGRVKGIFVQTSSSLTLKLWDSASAASGNVILNTPAAITAPAFFPFEADFQSGVFVTFGGTGSIALVVEV